MVPTNAQTATLNLGSLPPDMAMIERMVRDRIAYLGEPILLLQEYCDALGRLHQLQQKGRQAEIDGRPELADLLQASRRQRLTADVPGWLDYLRTKGPIDKAMTHPRYQGSGIFHEAGLEESVLVVAPRKWGKSELLKSIVWHHVQPPRDADPEAAVVVLDPGGDLAMQIARWPELSGANRAGDRLVYIEPEVREGLTVGLNPMDGTGLNHRERNIVAGMLIEAVGTLAAELTPAMRTLLRCCCTVLLSVPGATLRDLQVMLRDADADDRADALQAHGVGYADDEGVRDFFLHEFAGEGYKLTRIYLRNRLTELMTVHDFAGMFGGRATVDLRAAIEARKVVVVNLAKLETEDYVRLAGRLLVTMVGATARRRAQTPNAPRVPIHLVIDEATILAGNELVRQLAQLRKWGLNLILAQQVMGSGFSPEDKRTLIDNTGCRFIGGRDRRLVADMLTASTPTSELPAIERMHFWVEWPEQGGPHLLNVRSDLADYRRASTPDEWRGYIDTATDPLGGYYRPAVPVPPAPKETIDPVSQVTTSQGSHVPTSQDYEVPPSSGLPVAPVEAVKVPIGRPPRRTRAKPAEVVVKVAKPRTGKATKPVAKKAKAPDVKGPEREL